jgi:hypothetical protein
MALSRGSVNALNTLGARKLKYIPKHFAVMRINPSYRTDQIDQWIYHNLDSRYAITKSLKIDENNKMVEIQEIGVEDAKELTMLSLSCPHLDKTF